MRTLTDGKKRMHGRISKQKQTGVINNRKRHIFETEQKENKNRKRKEQKKKLEGLCTFRQRIEDSADANISLSIYVRL